jgi:hypothetical protein
MLQEEKIKLEFTQIFCSLKHAMTNSVEASFSASI